MSALILSVSLLVLGQSSPSLPSWSMACMDDKEIRSFWSLDLFSGCDCQHGERCTCGWDCQCMEPAEKRKIPRVIQRIVGYRYEQRCNGGYCQRYRVPVYVTETVYE